LTRGIFFGDSICHGPYLPPHLGGSSGSRRLGDRALVMNASVSGNTTREALEWMAYDVLAHSPNVLMVPFGMNDCNRWETDRGLPRVSEVAPADSGEVGPR
jgi:lysophospholipase L1-like esterase